ncbi:hypothetical protein R5H30_21380 [Sulfitobacter sp. D35]|uniref:hypothetical protein n=1 Tax=Sulfitobacter sp. D35 TaxID=3083252 RepID=UPI00296E504C|nr:hypothetical protein [Sulfitobacter sp. D35]MDW4500554.1 hypothetical protein [Sulfitobacter sp. D35]
MVTGRLSGAMGLGLAAIALASCASFGNTNAVKEANELAISCRTEEALAASTQASSGETLARELAELQKVVILRDAGRLEEADRALDLRNQRVKADAQTRAETEQAVEQSVADLRAQRTDRTGQPLCT